MVSARPVLDGGCSSSTTWSTLALDDVNVSVTRRPVRVRHGSVQHAPDATRTYVNTMRAGMEERCAQRFLGWGVDGCAAMCTVRRGCRRRACRADVVKSRFARLGTGRHRSSRGPRSWAHALTTCRARPTGWRAFARTRLSDDLADKSTWRSCQANSDLDRSPM